MGNILKSIFNAFECNSECSIHHELHDDIQDIKFCEMNLTQKEIKLINNIIKKKSIVQKEKD
tara:strand:+ start:198 stop:383 length:186 start_codon:yes stop_codon:yes gene_type:complete